MMHTCYTIHERPYTDRTKFVSVFSYERGIDSVAIPNKKRLLYFCQYQSTEKRKRLVLHSPTEHLAPLYGKTLFCGMYLNELIYRFCKPCDPHPDIFNQYKLSIEQLRLNQNIELTLRVFEMRLLKASGYEIDTIHIDAPYVAFERDTGFSGQHQPTEHNISLCQLNNMIHSFKPSPQVKVFFRHILNSLLPSILQSRQLYEKINLA